MSNEKVRPTVHRGRTNKEGQAYNPKHNDRNFDTAKAENIDPEKSPNNHYWCCYENMTFEEAEKKFYQKYFQKSLDAKNQRYVKNRHPEKQQTMDDYRATPRRAPEEIIFQLGNKNQKVVDPETLRHIFIDFTKWQNSLWKDKSQNVRIVPLNYALHLDEPNCDSHIQYRQVYLFKGKDGWESNQEKVLEALGFERPDLTKPKGQYNNRKQTFTKVCREKYIEIAKSYGINIEEIPKEPSKSGLSLLEYKRQQEEEKIQVLEAKISEIAAEKEDLENKVVSLSKELDEAKEKVGKMHLFLDDTLDRFLKYLSVSSFNLPKSFLDTVEFCIKNFKDWEENLIKSWVPEQKIETKPIKDKDCRKLSKDVEDPKI